MSGSFIEQRSKLKEIVSMVAVCIIIALFMGPEHFNGLEGESWMERPLNRVYFVLSTLSTVGYGDISPRSPLAKSIGIIIMFTMLVTVAV